MQSGLTSHITLPHAKVCAQVSKDSWALNKGSEWVNESGFGHGNNVQGGPPGFY